MPRVTDEEAGYDKAHSVMLSEMVTLLNSAEDNDQAEIGMFSGSAAALFALLVASFQRRGHEKQEAIAKAEFWWEHYGKHLAAHAAQQG